MIGNEAPCKNCERRCPNCHSVCQKYQEYNRVNEEYRAEKIKSFGGYQMRIIKFGGGKRYFGEKR